MAARRHADDGGACRLGCRRVHDEQDAGGACSGVSRESGDIRGPGQGNRLQQRVCERLYRRCGDGGRSRDRGIRRAECGMPAGGSTCCVDWRHWRGPQPSEGSRRRHEGARHAQPRRAPQCAAGNHDHRPLSERVSGQGRNGRRHVPRRRHDEGLGDDRAANGHDAWFSDVRCPGGTSDAQEGPGSGDARHLQRDYG